MREMQALSLGLDDSLEEGMATHSSVLAWRIPRQRSLVATVHGVTVSQTQLKRLSTYTCYFSGLQARLPFF